MLNMFWRTKKPVSRFDKCEEGAVTVDWVVLSAIIVIFGTLMIGIYRGGVYNLSSAISESIVDQKPNPDEWPLR